MTHKFFASICLTLLLAGCGSGEEVSRASFEASGDTWPLSVESGTLTCENGDAIFFEAASGRRFYVNGTAGSYEPGLPHLDEITRVDHERMRMLRAAGDANPFEIRMDTQKLWDIGLSLC